MATFRATKKHIGKDLYPVDNSYSQDLSNGKRPDVNNGSALAGDQYANAGLKVKIIFGPFVMTIRNPVGDDTVEEFCIVEYDSKSYLVLNVFSNEQPQPDPFDSEY
jgi:hypothetical protein